MQTIVKELKTAGVEEDHIIYLDLDRYGFRSVKTPDQLEALIEPALKIRSMKYLFIDDVQNVEGFEEVVNEFRAEGDFSIFITGSNSYLLSGELATKLTGRYVEFEIQALSFKEYREMKRFLGQAVDPDPVAELDRYILEGGFPRLSTTQRWPTRGPMWAPLSEKSSRRIFEKDIRRRVKVKNVSVFNQVRDYVINNFIAHRRNEYAYIQVAMSIAEPRPSTGSTARSATSATAIPASSSPSIPCSRNARA